MTLAARLQSLRRQAGGDTRVAREVGTPAASPASSTESLADPFARPVDRYVRDGVDDLRQRVAALRRLLGRRPLARESDRAASRAASQDRCLPGVEVAAGVHLVERWYALPELPQSIALHGLRSPAQQRHARVHEPDAPGVVHRGRLLAIDTETTGLAGGTGTRAFMIGVADMADERLRVRQLLTTTMAGEAGMLRLFCDWLREDHVLVSYNGRSYDRPLLSTRLRLARLSDPLPALIHLDLLHVTRRAYRGAWPNCRLATAERELLGVVRDDDLPGSEAPGAWLTWLRGGSSALLHRVTAHNDQDLRSLMGLVAHFAAAA